MTKMRKLKIGKPPPGTQTLLAQVFIRPGRVLRGEGDLWVGAVVHQVPVGPVLVAALKYRLQVQTTSRSGARSGMATRGRRSRWVRK